MLTGERLRETEAPYDGSDGLITIPGPWKEAPAWVVKAWQASLVKRAQAVGGELLAVDTTDLPTPAEDQASAQSNRL